MKPFKFNAELYPIMSPKFNLREICKQMVLLEDHLNQVKKRCPDCIRKHLLTIEGLFEEAISLDTEGSLAKQLEQAPDYIRYVQERWLDGADERKIAQAIRQIRKGLTPLCFDMRKVASEGRDFKGLILKQANSNLEGYLKEVQASRVASLYLLATKTESEREDSAIEDKVREEPRKKPPHPGTRSRYIGKDVGSRDPDLGGVGKSEGGDPDLFRKRKAFSKGKKKLLKRFPKQFYTDLSDVRVKNPNTKRDVLLSSLKPHEDLTHQKIVNRFYDKWKKQKKKEKRKDNVDLSAGFGGAFNLIREMSAEDRDQAYENAYKMYQSKKTAKGKALTKKLALLGVSKVADGSESTEYEMADSAIKRLVKIADKKGTSRKDKGKLIKGAASLYVSPMSKESREALILSMDGMDEREIVRLTDSEVAHDIAKQISEFDDDDPYGRNNLRLSTNQIKANRKKHAEVKAQMIEILKSAAASGIQEDVLRIFQILEGKEPDKKSGGSPSRANNKREAQKKAKNKEIGQKLHTLLLESLKKKNLLTDEQEKALKKALIEGNADEFFEKYPRLEKTLLEQ